MNRISFTMGETFIGPSNSTPYLAEQYSQNGHFDVSFELKAPAFIVFNVWYKYWSIYVKPGDSVTFQLKGVDTDQKVVFSGRNQDRYNLFASLSDSLQKAPYYNKFNNLLLFKTAIDAWRVKTELWLESYLRDRSFDKDVVDLARSMMNYRYVGLIYHARLFSKHETLPVNYFLQANKYDFSRDRLLSLIEYRYAIYHKYVTTKSEKTTSELEGSYHQIQSQLKGKTREFALANLVGYFVMKQSREDSLMLRKILNELYQKKLDSTYTKYLKDNEMRYFIIGRPMPDTVLNNTWLTDYNNNEVRSLGDVLKLYKNKPVYIDIWASWCVPCRDDILNSKDGKKLLAENDVAYLYFSTDTDNDKWKKAAEHDDIKNDQYRLERDRYKSLATFLELTGIPRYILLDKDHLVRSLFAPRPTPYYEKDFRKVIADLSKKL